MTLFNIAQRYPLPDRRGKPIDIAGRRLVDQHGKDHSSQPVELTSIVLLSAERGDLTRACIENLFRHTEEPFEVIISDVGSSEETLNILHSLEDTNPNLTVIYNPQSRGTGGQRNQAVLLSRGRYVVFMDNDVLALPGWLSALQEEAHRDSNIALVGAKLLKKEPEFVYYCGLHTISLERDGEVYGIGLDKEGEKANLSRQDERVNIKGIVPWYPTTTLLARRESLIEFGGFDDWDGTRGIMLANEDKDLSLTARKYGYKIIYTFRSEVIHAHEYHKVDRTNRYHRLYRLRNDLIERDILYLMKKWKLEYMLEKLPHEDNTRRFEKGKLTRVKLDLTSDSLAADMRRIEPL